MSHENQPNVGKYTFVPWMVWGPWLPLATSRAKHLKILHQNYQVRGAFPVSSGSRLQASGEKNVCVCHSTPRLIALVVSYFLVFLFKSQNRRLGFMMFYVDI